MSKRAIRLLLADLCEHVQRVDAFTMGMDREAFSREAKTVDAVVRNLCVIGWIASRLPETYRDACPEVSWKQIIEFGTQATHAYFDVDVELVWTLSRQEVPKLMAVVQSLQAEDV